MLNSALSKCRKPEIPMSVFEIFPVAFPEIIWNHTNSSVNVLQHKLGKPAILIVKELCFSFSRSQPKSSRIFQPWVFKEEITIPFPGTYEPWFTGHLEKSTYCMFILSFLLSISITTCIFLHFSYSDASSISNWLNFGRFLERSSKVSSPI